MKFREIMEALEREPVQLTKEQVSFVEKVLQALGVPPQTSF